MVQLRSRPPGLVKRGDPYPGLGWQGSGPEEPMPTDRGSGELCRLDPHVSPYWRHGYITPSLRPTRGHALPGEMRAAQGTSSAMGLGGKAVAGLVPFACPAVSASSSPDRPISGRLTCPTPLTARLGGASLVLQVRDSRLRWNLAYGQQWRC